MLTIDTTVRLANGVQLPVLGLGTYRVGEGPEVEHEVFAAFEAGYRSIDTAALYGNEHGVGWAIRQSGVPRSQVFVATKVWNDDQGYQRTLDAMNASLERLEMEYVDLYLVHWPIAARMSETWRAMEQILARGKARAIGVCNFLVHHLEDLSRTANVQPMVDQFEFHPRLQQPDLVAYCRDHAIQPEAWAPTMRGRVLRIPELVRIGERHHKTAVQVSLRWIVQREMVAIPKSVHDERIRENAEIFDFELSPEEMAAISELDRGERIGAHPDRFGA